MQRCLNQDRWQRKRYRVVLGELDTKGKLSCRCTTELNHWERFMGTAGL